MTEYGIFSDLLKVKPEFSFEYDMLEYVETVGVYLLNHSIPLTDEQKTEILQHINDVVVPNEWYVNVRTVGDKGFLAQTDWYTIRKVETGVEVPDEILQQRAEARQRIDAIKAEYQ